MIMPWNFRPDYHMSDAEFEDGPNVLDWEDTAGSNALAWASSTFLPRWCQTEEHWSAKVMNYFWAECACCLFWRGATVGLMAGIIVGLLAGIII